MHATTTFDGIIFDFNGVLLWDTPLHDRAWNAYATTVRGTPFTAEEQATLVHGRTSLDTLSYLFGHLLTPAEADTAVEQKEVIYRQMCLDLGDDFRLSPGAVALLDWLADHGVPRAIATSSGRRNVDFFISHLDLERWFAPGHIVYDDGSMPGKPAPDIYLQAAAVLGLPPGRCVVVEDSQAGIRAAASAGIGHVVALVAEAGNGRAAVVPGVDRVIRDLGRLPRTLLNVR